MPYIKQEQRDKIVKKVLSPDSFDPSIGINSNDIETAGDLNYTFTVLAHDYLRRKGLNYQHINDIIGALEGCKLEIYRRVASDYEDEKINLNGDVKEI
jgi:hypothetical protein